MVLLTIKTNMTERKFGICRAKLVEYYDYSTLPSRGTVKLNFHSRNRQNFLSSKKSHNLVIFLKIIKLKIEVIFCLSKSIFPCASVVCVNYQPGQRLGLNKASELHHTHFFGRSSLAIIKHEKWNVYKKKRSHKYRIRIPFLQ